METQKSQLDKVPYWVRSIVDDNQRRYAGLTRVLPDFLIVGAQKAGTTSLYHYLKQHPQIVSASHKEVHFFDYNFHKGSLLYKSYFPRELEIEQRKAQLNKKVITGETSPYYLFHPLAPYRIAKLLPEVKIIILLRDPAVRTYSHYQHEVRKGRESLAFEEALEQEEKRLQGEVEKIVSNRKYCSYNHTCFSYVSRSLYLAQVKVYYKLFKQDNILILSSENFFSNTQQVYEKILDFLGLETASLGNKKAKNVGIYNKSAIPLEKQLRAYFQPHNQKLYEYLQRDFNW